MIRASLTSAWGHRRRLASTTFAIVLGVAFLSATLVVRDSVTAGFATTFTAANSGTDAVVRNADDLAATDEPRAPIVASLRSRIDALDGVAATAPTVSGLAQILGSDGRPIGGNGPPTLGANWITVPALTGYQIASGRAPAKPGEVVIDARSAKAGHLHVSSRTTVLTPGPTAVTVVGIARFGEADSLGSATYVAFTLPEAQRIFLHDSSKVTSIVSTGPPAIRVIGSRRNERSTAFLSHWWTTQPSAVFAATRTSPRSSRPRASSTASLTGPVVFGETLPPSSKAAATVA